jgi:hypothetical protein
MHISLLYSKFLAFKLLSLCTHSLGLVENISSEGLLEKSNNTVVLTNKWGHVLYSEVMPRLTFLTYLSGLRKLVVKKNLSSSWFKGKHSFDNALSIFLESLIFKSSYSFRAENLSIYIDAKREEGESNLKPIPLLSKGTYLNPVHDSLVQSRTVYYETFVVGPSNPNSRTTGQSRKSKPRNGKNYSTDHIDTKITIQLRSTSLPGYLSHPGMTYC